VNNSNVAINLNSIVLPTHVVPCERYLQNPLYGSLAITVTPHFHICAQQADVS